MNEIHAKDNSWYIHYDFNLNETALVICGNDGVGTMFIILADDHIEEFWNIVDKNDDINSPINGTLGECIRYAAQHKDLIPERCTIGGVFSSKLRVVSNQK